MQIFIKRRDIVIETKKDKNQNNRLENKLFDARTILIYGEINQEVAERVSKELLALQEINNEPIKIFINSQGGHVEAGDTIHDMIKFITPEVYMIGTGWVASAGVSIYLAANKDRRYMLPNTRFMIHQPLGGVQGSASDIKIEMEELQRIRLRINKLISDSTGQPLEKVKEDTNRNYWMNPEETIEYGIASKVIKSNKELEV